ncbi:bifunctional serine/threonine-protein kinase/ABC transporter substrate-binding protein [Streptomyces rhizosphaerihabitans]|uniref:bifunctional serine/threonine-protein kinase/ABC transporter substrate-binding protein n=1 Tax=Streptomyces rhizosphaerihabitans TaxID=1266770 RepID=UPI0021BF27F4|nr:bifunctional serine/threonine-protein kinase/ABC transporter substrate-binding protein [Streptomyces rhizosphaerihabitans]MCT9010898.1 bifunctional serine/threonine-protein kinase/ABC transporter substrate-binding protein [Streptomyces rhizosphaerihabitans]
MEPLRGADPARIAGYRLLRRLGAGGMGVVYLARSAGGALAAVKVIRAAYADDAGFRARFRREVETGGRVANPWVVPLLDADPDAESPWLATAFVPGPSLAEAVEECGPLPYGTVRVLGARLAEALDAVHGAGLVHRDVKPGNVLLAVDGPRMIDFGIARMPEDTALTASGMVVGSPGFLSPEQAQGRGREIGPASDVFSLGCLLAYAVTGERPFGHGSAAGMLVRTVHDEPELDHVPESLLPLLRGCLAKEPGSRPTVAGIRRALDGTGEDGGWLPESLTRLIARRSAAVLALPAVDATEVSGATVADAAPGAETAVGSGGSTRRRFLVLGSAAGVLTAGGTAAWWTARKPDRSSAQGSETRLPRLVVALHADLSGSGRTTGRAQENGVRLALDHLNSRAGRGFDLALQVHDDEGSTTRARQVARRLTADGRVRAVLGPTTDACAKSTLGLYQQARLPMVTVSVGLNEVDPTKYRVYAATRPDDATLAAPVVAYLVRTAGARKTVLIDDAAEGDFSWRLCAGVDAAVRSTVRRTLAAEDDADGDFRALAESVTDAGADAVVFGGGYARAARLARALRSAGYSGARLAGQRALDPRFLASAGDAAEGWVFTTAFLDPTRVTAAKSFVAAYRTRFDTAPPWYSAEAYDATLFVARAMTALGASRAERGAIMGRLRETDYRGITKRLRYDSSTYRYADAMYLFRATGGAFRCLGDYRDATA